MSELYMFLVTGVRELYCRITHHRWLYLPVHDEPDLVTDRVCTRCYTRIRRTRADVQAGPE
jgi:hypothetical protein